MLHATALNYHMPQQANLQQQQQQQQTLQFSQFLIYG